jgi:hypothetical protein
MARENSGWGLRPHRRWARQPWASSVGSDGQEHPSAARLCPSSQTQPNHVVEGLPSSSYERASGVRFLYGGSAQLARAGDLLCIVLPSSGKPMRPHSRNHQALRPGVDGPDRARRRSVGAIFVPARYVLHDRDTEFCASFRSALANHGVKTIPLPAKNRTLMHLLSDGPARSNRSIYPS